MSDEIDLSPTGVIELMAKRDLLQSALSQREEQLRAALEKNEGLEDYIKTSQLVANMKSFESCAKRLDICESALKEAKVALEVFNKLESLPVNSDDSDFDLCVFKAKEILAAREWCSSSLATVNKALPDAQPDDCKPESIDPATAISRLYPGGQRPVNPGGG